MSNLGITVITCMNVAFQLEEWRSQYEGAAAAAKRANPAAKGANPAVATASVAKRAKPSAAAVAFCSKVF